jgi:large subunit ribosomal protein L4
MPTANLREPSGGEKGTVELPPALFDAKINRHAMWQAVTTFLTNQRQGTSAVKTRGMVSGGGKKPFRQKGTGRARQGTSRSNIMVGGARAFGPMPRDYHIDLPKGARRQALKSALTVRAREGQVTVLTETGVHEGRTREVRELVQKLNLVGRKCLLILESNDPVVVRAARNLPLVSTTSAAQVNTYEVMHADHLLITSQALTALKEARGQ